MKELNWQTINDPRGIDERLQEALGELFEAADSMEDGAAKSQVLGAMKEIEEVKRDIQYEKTDELCDKMDIEEAASRAACCLKPVVLILQAEADHAESRNKTELLYGLSYIVGNAISELER